MVGSCGRASHDSSVALKNRVQNTTVSREPNSNVKSPAYRGPKVNKSVLLHARYNFVMLNDTTYLISVLDHDGRSKWTNMFLSAVGDHYLHQQMI